MPTTQVTKQLRPSGRNWEAGSLDPDGRLEPILTYNEFTQLYKDSRAAHVLSRFSPGDRLQLYGGYRLDPCGAHRLAEISKQEFKPNCRHCEALTADQDHILWVCPSNEPPRMIVRQAPEAWEHVIG